MSSLHDRKWLAIIAWLVPHDIFPGSSMVEQEAVNFEVAGSSPAPGARPSREKRRPSS